MQWNGGDVIGKIEKPNDNYDNVILPNIVKTSKYYENIKALKSKDTFIRFQAIGRITESDLSVLSYLVMAVDKSDNKSFNRDVMECIHYFLIYSENNKDYVDIKNDPKPFINLLKSKDKEIRSYIAENIGLWNIIGAESALIQALNDESESVRKYSIKSLEMLKNKKALSIIKKIAENDNSEVVRKQAIHFIVRLGDKKDIFNQLTKSLKQINHHLLK